MARSDSPYVFREDRPEPPAEPETESVVIVDDEVVRYEEYATRE